MTSTPCFCACCRCTSCLRTVAICGSCALLARASSILCKEACPCRFVLYVSCLDPSPYMHRLRHACLCKRHASHAKPCASCSALVSSCTIHLMLPWPSIPRNSLATYAWSSCPLSFLMPLMLPSLLTISVVSSYLDGLAHRRPSRCSISILLVSCIRALKTLALCQN